MKKSCLLFLMACSLAAMAQEQGEETIAPITISYNGTTASVDVPAEITDVNFNVSGANVTISSTTTKNEYTYVVSGQASDGSLVITGEYKLTLQLAGLDLTNNHSGAAVDLECGKRCAIELVEGTVNTIKDAAVGSQKSALYCKGHLEFQGSGTLNVTGRTKHAIAAKEYLEIKRSTGAINVLGAASDGIHCGRGKADPEKNYFLMKGGVVNIMNVLGDGIDADDYGAVRIEDGRLSINIAADGNRGIKADSTLTVNGGHIDIVVSGQDCEAMRSCYRTTMAGGETSITVTGNGSKGIKAKSYELTNTSATVRGGGFVSISGGTIDIETLGDHLIDTTLDDTTKCMGMSIDTDLVQTGGAVMLTAMGPDATALNVKGTDTRTGGTLQTLVAPWKLNRTDFEYDMTVYARIDGIAHEGTVLAAFADDECRGLALPVTAPDGSESYYQLRVYSNLGQGEAITFRCYEQASGTESSLTGTATFVSTGIVGMPGEPLVLTAEPQGVKGDVNHDGAVDIADVVAVYNIMAGNNQSGYNGDVNKDGATDIADVVAIYNIMAGGN